MPRVLISILILSIACFSSLSVLNRAAQPPSIFQRDLIQLQAQGLAFRNDSNPYAPVPELVQTVYNFSAPYNNPHPSPYPPPAMLLAIPLSYLGPVTALWAWALLSAAALLGSVAVLCQWTQTSLSKFEILSLTGLVGLSNFFQEDLRYGQNGALVLLFFSLAVYFHERKNSFLAGTTAGILCAMKFVSYPLAAVFLFLGNKKALACFALTFLFLNASTLLLIGSDSFLFYYKDVAPKVSRFWMSYYPNTSLFNVIPKFLWPQAFSPEGAILDGSRMGAKGQFIFLVSGGITFLLLLSIFIRARNEESKLIFARIAAFSSIGLPVTWIFYQALLLVPVGLVLSRAKHTTIAKKTAFLMLVTLAFMMVDYHGFLESSFAPLRSGMKASLFLISLSLVPTIIAVSWMFIPFPSAGNNANAARLKGIDVTPEKYSQ